jgi:hypothetical protein
MAGLEQALDNPATISDSNTSSTFLTSRARAATR